MTYLNYTQDNMKAYFVLFLLVLMLTFPTSSKAEGTRKLRICSQNLHRFGEKKTKGAIFNKQLKFLAARIKSAHCDIVAAQEIYGETKDEAESNLRILTTELRERYASGIKGKGGRSRNFKAIVGDGIDKHIRNGFIIAEDVGIVETVKDYSRYAVPKLTLSGPARAYPRGPLGVLINLNSSFFSNCNGNFEDRLFLINIHFKSKVDAWKDPTHTTFETHRMETAEGIREIALEDPLTNGAIVLVAGDRNSPPGSAAAEILSGRRHLNDFRSGEECELTKTLKPDCKASVTPRQILLSPLFESRAKKFKGYKDSGSYRFRGKEEILDEILIESNEENRFFRNNGSYAIGYRGEFYKGSDHKLLWAELQSLCK